eukprot:1764162-Prymnesium_polylepis.4
MSTGPALSLHIRHSCVKYACVHLHSLGVEAWEHGDGACLARSPIANDPTLKRTGGAGGVRAVCRAAGGGQHTMKEIVKGSKGRRQQTPFTTHVARTICTVAHRPAQRRVWAVRAILEQPHHRMRRRAALQMRRPAAH